MSVNRIWMAGYRSLLNVHLPLGPLNVVTGANGVGKSNLYRAVSLIAKAVDGGLGRAIAEEGGMPSVLWAGPRQAKKPVRMTLGLKTADDEFSFEITLGLPQRLKTFFKLDPEVKEEFVWHGTRKPSTTFLKRQGQLVELFGPANSNDLIQNAAFSESALSQIQQPELYPELTSLWHEVRGWRFYHHFDTSPSSPLRCDQISTFSPVLDNDGSNLAAALQTIIEIGDSARLEAAIKEAFPGCRLEIIGESDKARLSLALHMPGLNRSLESKELSDGTLRFLCLAAALLTPRPPTLLAFNEPETSLHPDLLPALAGLIVDASSRCQVWVTTHSPRLTELIGHRTEFQHVRLRLQQGATVVSVEEDGP